MTTSIDELTAALAKDPSARGEADLDGGRDQAARAHGDGNRDAGNTSNAAPAIDEDARVRQSLEGDGTGAALLADEGLLDKLVLLYLEHRNKYGVIEITLKLKGKKCHKLVDAAVKQRASSYRKEETRQLAEEREKNKQQERDARQREKDEERARYEAAAERDAQGPTYGGDLNGLYRVRPDGQGDVRHQPLTNFDAKIIASIAYRGGMTERVAYDVAWERGDRHGTCVVPSDEFDGMRWIAAHLPSDAVIYPKVLLEACCAMRLLSGEPPKRIVYEATGWVLHDGVQVYRHSGGAIGPRGRVADIAVELLPELKMFEFADPPVAEERTDAIRSLLSILDVGPARVSLPLLAAMVRAPLGDANAVVWFWGTSGALKSSFVALGQSGFGSTMCTDETLPLGFDSTANALEAILHILKDALVVIDDFAPDGGRRDADRRNANSARLVRGTANRRGRSRMQRDGTTRETKPRALVIFTGEDLPPGLSIAARMVRVEIKKGDISKSELTRAQELARSGAFAQAIAAYIAWLATDLGGAQRAHRERSLRARADLQSLGPHARTAALLGDLLAALQTWLHHCVHVGALTRDEATKRNEDWKAEFCLLAATQAREIVMETPARILLRTLRAGLAAKRMHMSDKAGGEPRGADAWGWQREGDGWRPRGDRIGIIEGDDAFFDPDAAYAAAARYLQDAGRGLPLSSARSYGSELIASGVLAARDEERSTVRRTVNGERTDFWKIAIATFITFATGDGTDAAAADVERNKSNSSNEVAAGGPKPNGTAGTSGTACRSDRVEREPGDDDPDAVGGDRSGR